MFKLWHLHDRKFKRPIAELRLNIICAVANKSPLYRACGDLFTVLCNDHLTDICYLASVCGAGNSLFCTDVGFSMRVHGFDNKLLCLAKEMLHVFFSFQCGDRTLPEFIKPGRFEACLDVLCRKYVNTGMHAASLCSSVRLMCIRPNIWSSYSRLKALKNIRSDEFMEVIINLLGKVSIEALYHGNVDEKDAEAAKTLVSEVVRGLDKMPHKHHPEERVLMIPHHMKASPVVVPTLDLNEPNTAVEIYFQVGRDNISDRVLIDILVQMMYEPLYNQLRTKE